MRSVTRALALLMTLVACQTEEVDDLTRLTPREQLIRLSVDLRGIHPSERELVSMDVGDTPYATYVDLWLEDPRFVNRMKSVFNDRYLTRTGDTYYSPDEVGLSNVDRRLLGEIVSEEPLALLEHILVNDLPYSTIVTAPHSMANPALAQMWSMEMQPDSAMVEGEPGWMPATYTDARPAAGILTMQTIWERYPSAGGNANRHRANAISKMLLCDDYLSRPIVLNRAAVDQLTLDPENAIRDNPSCQSCHSTLDPLSATLFGFFSYDDIEGINRATYRPEFEENWRYYAGKEPGYYGRPTSNLVELGEQIAMDQRFVDCAVETVFEGLTQRDLGQDDWTERAAHTNHFVANGQSLRELARSIVMSEEYRAATVADPERDERIATVKTVTPAQLESIIEDLTGYKWTFRGRDGLTTNDRGLNVLLGGIDSRFVTQRSYIPSVGGVFTHERLAQAAGYHVAQSDLAPERVGDAKLLRFVTLESTPETDREAFEGQIASLYLDITGKPLAPDAEEPALLIELWKTQHSVDADPVRAWGGVVSAVLRDPAVLFY